MIKTTKMFLTASAMILSVSAQAFTLTGVVVDNSTKEPLIGATVQVGGTSRQELLLISTDGSKLKI